MKKPNKLAIALEKFMAHFYDRYSLIGSQIADEILEGDLDNPSIDELLVLSSKDKKDVVDQLQKSLVINQVFFKIRNDFIEDLLKNIKYINHQQNDIKRAQENISREDKKLSGNNKKIEELMLELDLSNKQKQTLKTILNRK